MINKIKEWIYKYIPSGLIPIFIVGILLIFSLIIMFFVYYKKPISLNNEITKTTSRKIAPFKVVYELMFR